MAARFWVGGTGNWDAANTTNWAATSGGAGGQSVPGSSDDVTFDANSGGGTVTVTATQSVNSITGGAHTGTLNINGQTLTCGTFNYSGTGTRSLTLGAANITITGSTGTVWNMGTITNLTLSAANTSCTITFTGASAIFNGGTGNTYNDIVMSGSGNAQLGNSIICRNFTRTGTAVKTDGLLLVGGNTTVTGTFTCDGNSAINRMIIYSSVVGSARTITAAAVSITNTDFIDITGAGAASWDLSAITGGSGDCGGNTGITFTTAATQTATGTASFSWSTHGWTSRVPLPQDDVVIDNAFVAGRVITGDMPRLGKSIDFTGVSGTPTFSPTNTTIYGSLTLTSDVTLNAAGNLIFAGRGAFNITTADKSFGSQLIVTAPGGTYTLVGDITTTANLIHNNGTFDAAGYNITVFGVTSNSGLTRSLTLGSGTWSLTSTSGVPWNMASAGLTFSGASATIVFSTTTTSTRTFAGAGLTYGTLTYTVAGSTGTLEITGANTFTNINFSDASNARQISFTAGTTTTITGNFNVFGTSGKLMTIASISDAQHTLSKASGTVNTVDYVTIRRSTAEGGASWYAGANSTDEEIGPNSGWIFSAAPSLVDYTSLTAAEYDWYAIRSGLSTSATLVAHKINYYISKGFGGVNKPISQMEREWLQSVGSSTSNNPFELWLNACQAQSVTPGKTINDCKMRFFTTVASGTNP